MSNERQTPGGKPDPRKHNRAPVSSFSPINNEVVRKGMLDKLRRKAKTEFSPEDLDQIAEVFAALKGKAARRIATKATEMAEKFRAELLSLERGER
jgi:hypothetical protein